MNKYQEQFLTAIVLTLSIALFSTNFLNAEKQANAPQDSSTVVITYAENP